MSRLWSLLVLLGMISSAQAWCEIRLEHQVGIGDQGGCMWSVFGTACNHLGYGGGQECFDWHYARGDYLASDADMEAQLNAWRIPHETRYRDFEFLKRTAARGLPAMIGFKGFENGHACLMLNVTAKWVYFFDPDKRGVVCRYSHHDFLESWDGWACVIEPKD